MLLFFEAWQLKVGAQLADRKGIRGAQFLDTHGYLQLLTSSHLREREKVAKVYSLWESVEEEVKCRFCVGKDGDGLLFWVALFPLSFM